MTPLKELVFLVKSIVDLIMEGQAFFKLSSQTQTNYSCHTTMLDRRCKRYPELITSPKPTNSHRRRKSLTLLDPKFKKFETFLLINHYHSEIIKQMNNNNNSQDAIKLVIESDGVFRQNT